LIGLAIVVSACAKEMPERVIDCDNFDVSSCATVSLPVDCETRGSDQRFVNVNVAPDPIVVAPPNRCIETEFGHDVTFNIRPANVEEGSVWICPKDLADTWLKGNNSPDNTEIIISVPVKDYPEDGEKHNYTVVKTDGKCLDPRMIVY
jgi:hypothetical protein